MTEQPEAAAHADGMRGAIETLPDQLRAGWARRAQIELEEPTRDVDAILVAGMGGSAIGGDLAAAVLSARYPLPIVVWRDYGLPAWVGRRTLVVASSFSGNTEETLSAWHEAGQRGARRAAITTGGRLGSEAASGGLPCITLPAGGAPRAALGHSLAALLGTLDAVRRVDGLDAEVGQAVDVMSRVLATVPNAPRHGLAPSVPTEETAGWLADRLAMIYAPRRLHAVAKRWKSQFNENGKSTAAIEALPELNHNALVGYAHPAGMTEWMRVVILDGVRTSPRMARRIALTIQLLDDAGIASRTVRAPDDATSPLAEAMWLVLVGDLISVDLADRHGEAPTPIAALDWLKSRLADGD